MIEKDTRIYKYTDLNLHSLITHRSPNPTWA